MAEDQVPDDVVEAALRLIEVADIGRPLALRLAISQGIFDQLSRDTDISVTALADRLGANQAALERLLQVLTAQGLVSLDAGHVRALALSGHLRADHPYSLFDAHRLVPHELICWGSFEHCLRTGGAAFAKVYGVDHRTYRAEHPPEDIRMDDMHRAASRLQALTLSRAYNWSDVHSVVDVGGGTGGFLIELLRRYPHLNATLFELAPMAERAGNNVAEAHLTDRIEIVAGDFFSSISAGADVYVLKSVLGGWSDESARKIMTTVARATRPDSKILIIEPILGYGDQFSTSSIVHMQSLLLYGGPDRTREEYDQLFADCGLKVHAVSYRAALPIMELVRV